MDDLFRLGLNNAAWATGLAVVAAVGARVWRSRPAVAHALWLLVLLKLATPSVLTIAQPWSEPPAPRIQVVEQPSGSSRLAASVRRDTSFPPASQHLSPPKRDAFFKQSNAGPEPVPLAEDTRSTVRPWPWQTLIALVWLSGAGFWWGFVGLSLIRFRRLLDSASAAPSELEERVRQQATRMGLGAHRIPITAIVPTRVAPMVWASLFSPPRLLLPQELWVRLDASQQNAVLAHELAHLKRRDHWVRWLEVVVLGIYWWDPVAWWARREVERTEEEACDALVLWSQPGTAGAYAEALVATTAYLSGFNRHLPVGASGVRNTLSLKRRLEMILSDAENAPMSRSRSWKLLAVGAVCLPLLPALSAGMTQDRAASANSGQTPNSDAQAKSAQPLSQSQDTNAQAKSAQPLSQTQDSNAQAKSAQSPSQTPNSDAQAKSAQPPSQKLGSDVRSKDANRVRVSRPIIRQVSEYADAEPTSLQPVNRVDLKAQVGGMLQSVSCKPTWQVRKGAVLFEIDSRTYVLERQKADADVRRLQSRFRSIEGRVRAINRNQIGANEEITRLQAEQEEAETVLLGAQATRDLATLKLESTRVTAPFDGVVTSVRVSNGDFVEAGRTDLATIISQGLLHADVYVEEATARRIDRARLKRETSSDVSVRFRVRDEAGFPHSASIDFVDLQVQPTNTVRLRLLVADPDGLFRPGLVARVRVILGPPREAILIPEKVIGAEAERRFVYILNDKNIVESRSIQVGQRYDDLRAIESGLRADEWVVNRAPVSRIGTVIPANDIDRIEPSPQPAEKPVTR